MSIIIKVIFFLLCMLSDLLFRLIYFLFKLRIYTSLFNLFSKYSTHRLHYSNWMILVLEFNLSISLFNLSVLLFKLLLLNYLHLYYFLSIQIKIVARQKKTSNTSIWRRYPNQISAPLFYTITFIYLCWLLLISIGCDSI
jgi:hypothetical protein